MTDITETEAAVNAGLLSAIPQPIVNGTLTVTAVPEGARVIITDDRENDVPNGFRGNVSLHESTSLIDYVNSLDKSKARLYADLHGRRIDAVLDDHTEDGPGFRKFTATCNLSLSSEWREWAGLSGAFQTQDEFTEHLDNNRTDILDPTAAELLEIVQTLQVAKDATWKRATRLENGEVRFTYNESVNGAAGRDGELVIPSTFTLSLPVYYGSDPTNIKAFLRYRLRAGDLQVGYKLIDADTIERNEFLSLANNVAADTGLDLLYGEVPYPLDRESVRPTTV